MVAATRSRLSVSSGRARDITRPFGAPVAGVVRPPSPATARQRPGRPGHSCQHERRAAARWASGHKSRRGRSVPPRVRAASSASSICDGPERIGGERDAQPAGERGEFARLLAELHRRDTGTGSPRSPPASRQPRRTPETCRIRVRPSGIAQGCQPSRPRAEKCRRRRTAPRRSHRTWPCQSPDWFGRADRSASPA